MLTKNVTENISKYVCEKCDFKCSKQSYWGRHIITAKHIRLTNVNLSVAPESDINKTYECSVCDKVYKSRVGLWKHAKTCTILPLAKKEENEMDDNDLKKIILDVVKNNSELMKQMMEMCQKTNTINSHNNNHSHNKTFNLNFFLNEQCKDAMNIMEFVDTFQLQFEDLEHVGEVGYVEGISSIIIDKLNKMDIYKRPIHCSDAKREIMHIKDNDVWTKDTENNDKLRLAIKHITKKNMDLVNSWVDNHPGVRDYDHRLNNKYQIIIIESVGGMKNDTIQDGETKIIKKISKMVLIDKATFGKG
jgi:hypothetical protein